MIQRRCELRGAMCGPPSHAFPPPPSVRSHQHPTPSIPLSHHLSVLPHSPSTSPSCTSGLHHLPPHLPEQGQITLNVLIIPNEIRSFPTRSQAIIEVETSDQNISYELACVSKQETPATCMKEISDISYSGSSSFAAWEATVTRKIWIRFSRRTNRVFSFLFLQLRHTWFLLTFVVSLKEGSVLHIVVGQNVFCI